MKETHGTQEVEVVAGRNVVVSAGIGKTNADDLKWLMQTVLSKVGAWKASGWAYIADCNNFNFLCSVCFSHIKFPLQEKILSIETL